VERKSIVDIWPEIIHSKSDCSLPVEIGKPPSGCKWRVPGSIQLRSPRYAYSTRSGHCKKFYQFLCDSNANSFKTLDECRETCEAGKDGAKGVLALLKKIWNYLKINKPKPTVRDLDPKPEGPHCFNC
jgi:hypothetical protein